MLKHANLRTRGESMLAVAPGWEPLQVPSMWVISRTGK